LKKVLFIMAFLSAFFTHASLIAAQVPEGFVLVNAATFTMGSPANEPRRASNELQRQVTLRPFYIGKTEVSQAEYLDVMGVNPSLVKGDKLPVEQVTWFKAVEYCNKLSEKQGLTPAYKIDGQNVSWERNANGYRLPTEAEWEYACRAGTETTFYTGNNITSEQANFNGTLSFENFPRSAFRGRTLAVGSVAPNAFGIYDMHGNVAEWCWDFHGEYAKGDQSDPTGASAGGYRIFRGGGWNHPADFLRSAKRSALTPSDRGHYLRFRVSRNAD
jgi:formylglycine-generating enzyme required for sulfatase activity